MHSERPSCLRCVYWSGAPVDMRSEVADELGEVLLGQCQRFPPTVLWTGKKPPFATGVPANVERRLVRGVPRP